MVGAKKVLREQNPARLKQFWFGIHAIKKGVRRTVTRYRGLDINRTKYYQKKVQENVYWGNHGGVREENTEICYEQFIEVSKFLTHLLNYEPTLSLCSYVDWIDIMFDFQMSKSWVSDVLYNYLGFSRKKAVVMNKDKFSQRNVDYYGEYLCWIREVDAQRLKYLDESHFDGRMSKIRYARSKKNERAQVVTHTSLKERCSLSLMMCLDHNQPFYFELREDTNTQEDFTRYLISALEVGYLKENDIIILDNSSIHGSDDTIEELDFLLRMHSIQIIRLPTYSPGKFKDLNLKS